MTGAEDRTHYLSGIPIYESNVVPDGKMFRTPVGLYASAATIARLHAALTPQRDQFWMAAGIVLALVVLLAVSVLIATGGTP